MEQIKQTILNKVIRPRPLHSYKGNYGRIITIGGNYNLGGAIIMSASACVYAGAGLVTCATDKHNLNALHTRLPEAMFVDYSDFSDLLENLTKADVIVLGPGLGLDKLAQNICQLVLSNLTPDQLIIIDGSAITLLAANPGLLTYLKKGQAIFTPHEMEWQRLSQIKIADQIPLKNKQAQLKLGQTVILKKYHTEIYHPECDTPHQLTIGGPYMATGGMGDTLTGILAAFLGQFSSAPLTDVIDAAVYTHSAVASKLGVNNYVTLPSTIIAELPHFMNCTIKE